MCVQKVNEMYEIVKHYRHDAALRASFNQLAEKTFGLNFENWYQNGYWTENYDPYSVVTDGKVVANVSVNKTDMVIGGERKHLIQLGTVMTEEAFRNRGLIRRIMAEIDQDYPDADGIYLFGGDNVLEFYPKFGFHKESEYLYTQEVSQIGACEVENVPMNIPENRERLQAAIAKSCVLSACQMVDNPGLIFFYASQFMQDCVYYCSRLDAWFIAEQEGGELLLHNIFCPDPVSPEQAAAAFGSGVQKLFLGFAPKNVDGYTKGILQEENCTFFVKGKAFADFAQQGLRIPSLAHA